MMAIVGRTQLLYLQVWQRDERTGFPLHGRTWRRYLIAETTRLRRTDHSEAGDQILLRFAFFPDLPHHRSLGSPEVHRTTS